MKRHERNRFAEEIVAGDEVSQFRREALAHTLRAAKRRRRGRLLVRGGGAICVIALMTFGIVSRTWRESRVAESPAPTPRVRAEYPGVKIINDEEMFALFPDRALALIGDRGNQRLIFLDEPLDRDSQEIR